MASSNSQISCFITADSASTTTNKSHCDKTEGIVKTCCDRSAVAYLMSPWFLVPKLGSSVMDNDRFGYLLQQLNADDCRRLRGGMKLCHSPQPLPPSTHSAFSATYQCAHMQIPQHHIHQNLDLKMRQQLEMEVEAERVTVEPQGLCSTHPFNSATIDKLNVFLDRRMEEIV